MNNVEYNAIIEEQTGKIVDYFIPVIKETLPLLLHDFYRHAHKVGFLKGYDKGKLDGARNDKGE